MKWVIAVFLISSAQAALAEEDNTIYDPDPHHLWNRLNETLFVRTAPDGKHFGLDELDILYWQTTRHLLSGASQQKALAVLDEFIGSHGERQVRDPLNASSTGACYKVSGSTQFNRRLLTPERRRRVREEKSDEPVFWLGSVSLSCRFEDNSRVMLGHFEQHLRRTGGSASTLFPIL